MKKKYKKSEVEDFARLGLDANDNNLRIEKDDEYYYLLEDFELFQDGKVIDNSEEYNKEQQRAAAKCEIAELKQYLNDNDYKVSKCTEFRELRLPAPYSLAEIHEDFEAKRARINELEKLINEN